MPSTTPQTQPIISNTIWRLFQIAAWGMLAVMIFKHMVFNQFLLEPGSGVDFPKHREAAVKLLQGISPMDNNLFLVFNYPTFTALLFVFLAWIPESRAIYAWDVLQCGLTAAACLMIIFALRPRLPANDWMEHEPGKIPASAANWGARHWPTIGALLCALFTPAFMDLHWSNIQPTIFFLVCLFCVLLHHGHDRTAGIALALLCLIKITPVLLLPALLFSGKRRVLAAWSVFMALYGILLLATGWWRWDLFLVRETLPNVGFRWRVFSVSIVSYLGKTIWPELMNSKSLYDTVSKAIALFFLALLIMQILLIRRKNGGFLHWRDAVTLTCYPIVLVSPLVESIHFTNCLPGWIFLFHDYLERRRGGASFTLLLLLWLGIFACRYIFEYSNNSISPIHYAVWLLLGVWLVTGAVPPKNTNLPVPLNNT